MRNILALTLLTACDADPADLVHEAPPTDAPAVAGYRNLVLTSSDPIWGNVLTLQLTGGVPGEQVHFVWGDDGEGAGPCPASLGGACLDVVGAKVLGNALVGASGVAELTVQLPASGPAGSSLSVQAVIARNPAVTSDPLTLPIADTFVDTFDFEPAAVDLLIVMDDSCSMYTYQQGLADAFPYFLTALDRQGLDYHIGVVTTDMATTNPNAGQLRLANGVRWVTPSTPAIGPTLRDMVMAGTNGHYEETGLYAMEQALEPNGLGALTNAGFERDDAQLAVLVITDEPDFSAGSTGYYSSILIGRKPWRRTSTLHALVGFGACSFGGGPMRYDTVANNTHGLLDDVCLADYRPFMAEVADTFYTSEPMPLSFVPASKPTVMAQEPGGVAFRLADDEFAWDAGLNAVRTTSLYVPAPGTVFTVTY